ncbi:hypothetical protein Pcinc_037033 [Petrolisthes cinctipes]|uniref:Male-enhanced antigen 1 n=1 Tax=Petrolisthes cinctipes TaxID=88211 RepID=A0AAE1BXD2_PETCI|nr:hypothetical protein Pcinc_037033 [Petrolisthes cinctipes]
MAPKPIQGGRLGPGSGGGGGAGGGDGDDDLTPPIGLTLGPVLSSSDDDELEHNDAEANNSHVQYLPLAQDHDSEDEGEYDQSTVAGLMQALATHGTNDSVPEEDNDDARRDEEGNQQHGEGEGRRQHVEGEERQHNTRIQRRELSQQTSVLVQESAQARDAEARREVSALWTCRTAPTPTPSTTTPPSDRLELDGKKVEEIKSAMSSITLPPSATPSWAHNLSDEDWQQQIATLLSRQQQQNK